MRLFLDANVLVAVLNKEYPVFSYASRIISLPDNSDFRLFTSPLSLAIAFYFAEKKSGTKHAREKIELLTEKISFTTMDDRIVGLAARNKKIHDLEDGMQYYSAIDSDCRCIITEDKNDFYFSEIQVLSCRGFLEKCSSK